MTIFGDEILVIGVTLEPFRPTYDAMGNVTSLTPLEPIENAVVMLNPPSPLSDLASQWGNQGYTLEGVLYAPRGAGLQNGDRFSHQGRTYDVIGGTQGDEVHALTGDDFGYVWYAIRWGG